MPRRGIDLTEDQWSIVKAHAARRRQTISQFFVDVLADLGMDGRPKSAVTTRMPPWPVAEDSEFDRHPRTAPVGGEITDVQLLEVSVVADTPENRAAGSIPIPSQPGKASSIGYSRPAPKPGKK